MGSNDGTVQYSYHAKGTVKGIVSVRGLIGTQSLTTASAVNCVAYSTSVSGTSTDNRINRLIGAFTVGSTITNSYYWQEMPLTGAGTGNGVTEITAMVQIWWEDKHATIRGPGFDLNTVWRWDTANLLPVLQGVTP